MAANRPTAVMTNARGYEFSRIISKARARAGLTQSELAQRLNVTVSAVGNWEAGLRRPDLNLVAPLCAALGISVGVLFGVPQRLDEIGREGRQLIERYRTLNATNRKVIDRMLDTLADLQLEELRERIRDVRCIIRSDLKACAGTGNALDEASGDRVYVHLDERAARADEIITVTGDSMEPTFHSGDEVLVEHCQTIRPGEIGIFVADGAGYIKEYRRDHLYSHNPDYDPLYMKDFEDVRCVGRVIGTLDPAAYATDEEIELLGEQ